MLQSSKTPVKYKKIRRILCLLNDRKKLKSAMNFLLMLKQIQLSAKILADG